MKRLLVVLMVVSALLSSVSLAAASTGGKSLGGIVQPNGFTDEWIEI